MAQQEAGDIGAAHMRGGAQPCLEITTTPIPGGVNKRRLLRQQLGDAIEIAVGDSDELLNQAGRKCGWSIHGLAPSYFQCLRNWAEALRWIAFPCPKQATSKSSFASRARLCFPISRSSYPK